MPYATPTLASPIPLLFSPPPLCSLTLPATGTHPFQSHAAFIFPPAPPENLPSTSLKDSNMSSNPLADVPRSKGGSRIKLSLSTEAEETSPPWSNVKRVRAQRVSTEDPVTQITRHTERISPGNMDTIGRSRGANWKACVSENAASLRGLGLEQDSGAPNKRLHQAVMAGQGNVLRLNLDAIKRTKTETSSTPTSSPQSSTAHASKAKFNTIGSSTCSTNLIRKKSGELVKPALRSSASSRSRTPERETAPFPISNPTPPGPHLASHHVPLARRNSAPSTPMTKFVHFDAQLEHVKLFLAEQKPAAVSRDGSPHAYSTTEDEWPWDVKPNKKSEEKNKTQLTVKVVDGLPTRANAESELVTDPEADVKFESLVVAEDGSSLRGSVVVKNLSFDKWIAARFTMDWWQTTSEVTARYAESIIPRASGLLTSTCLSPFSTREDQPKPSHDRFTFVIRLSDVLARIEEKTMFIAIRYNTCGREIWDNNFGKNYQVVFEKIKVASESPKPVEDHSAKTLPNKPSGWQVKTAVSPREQLADLRRELEKVVSDDNGGRPLLRADRKTFSFPTCSNESSPSQSPGPLPSLPLAPEAPSLIQGSESLTSRYDFAASSKRAWNPPPLPPLPHNVPLYQRTGLAAPKAASTIKQASTSTSGSLVPFPSSSSPIVSPVRPASVGSSPDTQSNHQGAEKPGFPLASARRGLGSPRDSNGEFEPSPVSDYGSNSESVNQAFDGAISPGESDPFGSRGRSRAKRNHHRRGATFSYFDGWAADQGLGLKALSPQEGDCTQLNGERQEQAPSNIEDITPIRIDGEPNMSAGEMNAVIEPAAPIIDLDAITSHRAGTPHSTHRCNSFPPVDSPPAKRFFYGVSASSRSNAEGVNGKSITSTWPPMPGSLPLPSPALDEEISAASTPSITSSSSPSQSPSSPPHALPMSPPPDLDVSAMFSLHGSARNRPAIDSSHYSFFLDRFCFFTGSSDNNPESGVGATLNSTAEVGIVPPRRIHSESEVADYFSLQAQLNAGGSMYDTPPMSFGGFDSYPNTWYGNFTFPTLASGHTTPTRSPNVDDNDDDDEKGNTTPRPSSPVGGINLTPVQSTKISA